MFYWPVWKAQLVVCLPLHAYMHARKKKNYMPPESIHAEMFAETYLWGMNKLLNPTLSEYLNIFMHFMPAFSTNFYIYGQVSGGLLRCIDRQHKAYYSSIDT